MSKDPVAAQSGFLCMYMSNHPDTLVSYVKHYGHVKGTVKSAKMTSIDTNGMDFTYTTPDNSTQSVRVPFDPPLMGYEEVKPRMLSMKVDAEEALGMTRTVHINKLYLSQPDLYIILPAIALLIYTTLSPARLSPTDSPLWGAGSAIRNFVGPLVIKLSWGFMIVAHFLESLYTLRLVSKNHTGFALGAQYVVVTLLFGVVGFRELRKEIQKARIDSIMKGH